MGGGILKINGRSGKMVGPLHTRFWPFWFLGFLQGIHTTRYANFSLGSPPQPRQPFAYSYLRREFACRLPRLFSSFFTSAVVACRFVSWHFDQEDLQRYVCSVCSRMAHRVLHVLHLQAVVRAKQKEKKRFIPDHDSCGHQETLAKTSRQDWAAAAVLYQGVVFWYIVLPYRSNASYVWAPLRLFCVHCC